MSDERKRRLLFALASQHEGSSLLPSPVWRDTCWICWEPIVPLAEENIALHMDLHLVELGGDAALFESFMALRTDASGEVDRRAAVKDFFGYDPSDRAQARAFWTKRRLGQR